MYIIILCEFFRHCYNYFYRLAKLKVERKIKSELKDRLKNYKQLKLKNRIFKDKNESKYLKKYSNSKNKIVQELKSNKIRPNLQKLCQNSDILNSKIRSTRLKANEINLKVDQILKSRNYNERVQSLPLKRPFVKNLQNFSDFNTMSKLQVSNSEKVDFVLIPTIVNLKEITDIHGRSFAKFNMRFKRPKEFMTMNNSSKGTTIVSQFK